VVGTVNGPTVGKTGTIAGCVVVEDVDSDEDEDEVEAVGAGGGGAGAGGTTVGITGFTVGAEDVVVDSELEVVVRLVDEDPLDVLVVVVVTVHHAFTAPLSTPAVTGRFSQSPAAVKSKESITMVQEGSL